MGPTLVPPSRYRRRPVAPSSAVGATTQIIIDDVRFDTVLVIGCAIPQTQPQPLLERCLSVAERAVVWVLPADDGHPELAPALAGCLPPGLVPEPGPTSAERLLDTLVPGYFPNVISSTPWRQTIRAADIWRVVDAIAEGTQLDPAARVVLCRELTQRARVAARGVELEARRCSAALIWYTA